MLQWMGGSRRKVTTSRNSTHKRQKQYFEQRKRQQQIAGLESYADERRLCTPHSENNRSLDILSLANVSVVAQEQKNSDTNANDNSEDDGFTLEHQNRHLPAIISNECSPVDHSLTNEERTSGSCGTEAKISNLISIHPPVHKEYVVENGYKSDAFKLSNMHRLGKVESETPLNSPRTPGRSFPESSSPLKKSRRQPSTFKHLDYGFDDLGSRLDVMMQDIDFSVYDNSREEPFCSRDSMNDIGEPSHKFINFRKSSPFTWKGNTLDGVLGDDELIYNIRDSGRNIWNGPNFLDASIDDLGEHGLFQNNWLDQRTVCYDDYIHNKDWMQDYNFRGSNLQKKRSSTDRADSFNMREPPVSHARRKITEDLPDVMIPDAKWYSAIGTDDNKDAAINFFREESLSLPSEESSTSTAVRGNTTKK